MKRVVCLFLAVLTCLSITLSAAAVSPTDNLVTPYATSIPTQMAPASWYDTPHYWTARYYTYTSYIFSGADAPLWVDIIGPQPFSVDFVSTDGKYDTYTVEATLWSSDGEYAVLADVTGMTFYMIIRNQGTTSIVSNAYYNVYHPEGVDLRSIPRTVISNVA